MTTLKTLQNCYNLPTPLSRLLVQTMARTSRHPALLNHTRVVMYVSNKTRPTTEMEQRGRHPMSALQVGIGRPRQRVLRERHVLAAT